MTYRGDIYFVSVLVPIIRDYTGWHAINLIKGYPYLLTKLSYSFSLSTIPRSEVKDGEK
ncbi:hypothetical protein SLEP1_g22369 [Rubroshorea leprosula]|uniref:Uncharacterized protein n=1 Tax=Rubroshorea leprosula TaxID=152421 RepID=A0AAV5JI84_9ROSI|nr:hypothetical protein SLEP1_g22369 [Rubroshorea leprosula]